jgi:hypothetical protein
MKTQLIELTKRFSLYIIGILVVGLIFLAISQHSKRQTIKLLRQEVRSLQAQNNALYQNNLLTIQFYKTTIQELDSIHKLTYQSHETEITAHWDSVYNSISTDATSYEFITEYLEQLGNR